MCFYENIQFPFCTLTEHLDIFFLGNAFNYFTGTSTDIPNGAMWTYDDNVVVPVYRKDDCKK